MSQIIGILDYGETGNIFNIKKSLEAASSIVKIKIINNGKQLSAIDKLIFPGVGAYPDAMKGIAKSLEGLRKFAASKPVLGICLGMQILSERGYEFGQTKGLNILEGEVMKMATDACLPHLGWATIDIIKSARILKGVTSNDYFYFMHSYEFINYKDVVGLSSYAGHNFVSVLECGNVFGVQFHPEKSRESGMKIFKNFVAM